MGSPPLHPNSLMEPGQCAGALTPEEIQTLEAGTELRLYTCAVCGKRNLYPIKNAGKMGTRTPYRADAKIAEGQEQHMKISTIKR
jgi:hypothetical protein